MPVFSRFFGIVIFMHWNDHQPPHFHAKYSDFEAMIGLDGAVLEGSLPRRAMALVMEWRTLHQRELQDNWDRVRLRQPLNNIDPLE
ncbi:MAG: DUF4160 domain-containing protein [Magnetococcales bacterium]|nr:DUF4160 domain-containing protein [Magnetococcales bacterium]